MKNYPKRYEVYTLAQLDSFDLRDMPTLRLMIDNELQAIQTSHLTMADHIKSNPLWAETLWEFIIETTEWIPIFNYRGDTSILDELVDVEPWIDPHQMPNQGRELYVVPKGYPREQYYSVEKHDGEYKIKKPAPIYDESPYYLLPELPLRDGKHPMTRKNLRICGKCNHTYESQIEHKCADAG